MPLLDQLTADDRLVCLCLFGFMHDKIAIADGKIDRKEAAVFDRLLHGHADPASMLTAETQAELHCTSDLARELLAEPNADFATYLTDSNRDFLAYAVGAGESLQRFVDRAEGDDDRAARISNARGILFESIHFAKRTAQASGGWISKINPEERDELSEVIAWVDEITIDTSLGVSDVDVRRALDL